MFQLDFRSYPFQGCVVILLVAVLWTAKRTRQTRGRIPFPPGPQEKWFARPAKFDPMHLSKLTEAHGPVFSLRLGTRRFVFITRYQAAVDIMEKQGASIADRPRSIAAGEVLSGGLRISMGSSPETHRLLRRVMHSQLQSKVAITYEGVQTQSAKNLALDLLDDPVNHQMHLKRYAASVIMSITYGKTTPSAYTDPEIIAVNRCMDRFSQTAAPGSYLVDLFPFLKYVPGYMRTLRKWHKEELALFQGQINIVKQRLAEGKVQPCFAKYLLEHQVQEQIGENQLAYLAGTMFGNGADSTAIVIGFMIMAAALYPEAQARVQKELDAVVGRERLPTFADKEKLVQLWAFVLETLRWRPSLPGGVPHLTTKDVMWNGYMIPAGTVVIGNHWAIANDPEVFPNPERFDPQRWINEHGLIGKDMDLFTFGFGRRACPARPVANRSFFIAAALVLWGFRISQDPAAPINSFAFSKGVLAHPVPYKAIFELRVEPEVLRRLCTEK